MREHATSKCRTTCGTVAVCLILALSSAYAGVHSPYGLPAAGYRPICAEVSPSGRWLALSYADRHSTAHLDVYDVETGKRITGTTAGPWITPAWHPTKPRLAVYRDEGLGGGDRVILSILTGKMTVRQRSWGMSGDGTDAWTWLPDGKDLIGPSWNEHVPGLWPRWAGVRRMSIDSDWAVAAWYWPTHPNPGPPAIGVYRKDKARLRYRNTGRLSQEVDQRTGRLASAPMLPGFLSSGRLAYARVFFDDQGERKALELWTCRKDGKDQRKWLSLPVAPEKEDPDLGVHSGGTKIWMFPPISWSRDGTIIAYVYKGDVYVKQVKPPK